MKELKGVMPPIITAFNQDESFDEKGMRAHVDWLVENGVHGLIPTGSTGEFIALSLEERKRVIDVVLEAAAGRVLVYAGAADYSTRTAIELSRFAEKAGADGVMIVNPYYIQPPIEDVLNHFRAIRQSVGLPIMLYNNPWVCGYELSVPKLVQLAEEGVIQSVKLAHGPAQPVHELLHFCGDKLAVMYGADVEAPEGLLAGAAGWVTSLINVAPRLCRRMYEAAAAGDVRATFEVWNKLLPLIWFTYNGGIHWLQVVKTSIHLAGRPGGPPRRPTTLLQGRKAEELRQILAGIGLL